MKEARPPQQNFDLRQSREELRRAEGPASGEADPAASAATSRLNSYH